MRPPAFVFFLIAALLLAACGGNGDDAPTPPADAAPDTATTSEPSAQATANQQSATTTAPAARPAQAQTAPEPVLTTEPETAPEQSDDALTPTGTLAFAAGGSIYIIDADGTGLRQVVAGNRDDDATWAAAPDLAPDGTRLLFTRNFDVWSATTDGQSVERLIDFPGSVSAPGASNFSLGAQTVAWSPDGRQFLIALARIGGSGLNEIWVANSDGADLEPLRERASSFLMPTWVDNENIAADLEGKPQILRFPLNGVEHLDLGVRPSLPQRLIALDGERWLLGSFTTEGDIRFGRAGQIKRVEMGVSPEIAPDGKWFAYFRDETIRVARVDGSADHLLVDLEPLGRRDHHHASACTDPACSYRAPSLSWVD